MTDRFPHLTNNNSDFPYVGNVDVYKYDNDFDYSRYDYDQMEITICKVPWDMGEAHVGNRTISGIGNVVWFETKAKRDAWFDAIPDSECVRYTTKYKQLHRDNKIRADIPFDVASNYNYVYVRYNKFANDDSPVEGESDEGRRDWFWFVREVEFVSPNTTILHLLNDAWQTFIYDIDISSMILERGHAPMFSTSVAQYLENPIENCADLLTEEMYYGDARICQSSHDHIFNAGDMYALIVSTSNPVELFGSKGDGSWYVPAKDYIVQGVLGYCAFVMDAGRLNEFLLNVDNDAYVPQFKQTIQAICFVPKDMVTVQTAFNFCGIPCNLVTSNYASIEVHDLVKDDFNYPARYADIAKLYTYPYSYLLVTDSSGNETEIHVEDTDGTITLDATVNLVYPWLQINGAISSVGNAARRSLSFTNIDTRNMPIEGNWAQLLMQWEIPCFGVVQQASITNDYATHFDRAQLATARDNAQANANQTADATFDNAVSLNAYNNAVTTSSIASAGRGTNNANTYTDSSTDSSNSITSQSAASTIAANELQGNIAAAGAAIGGVAGAVASVASGNIAGAVAGAINAGVGAATTLASTQVANGLTATNAQYTVAGNDGQRSAAKGKTNRDYQDRSTTLSEMNGHQNDLNNAQTATNVYMMRQNAQRNANTVTSQIANQQAQAALSEPALSGDWKNGEYATSRPMGMFVNVMTQNANAIRKSGDEFSRYGYMYDGFWQFDGNWNVGKHFTYWKLADFWISGLNVPDMYVDKIRFFLFGGVTVWHDPEEIGNVSIYDNFPD